MIPQSFIDELLNRMDVVDVVGQHVPLKKSGQNYVACCPFHQEKTPSFSVSPSKQFFYCFGCGAHGSALGFVMQHLHLSFVEAVEMLAGQAGVAVPRESSSSGQTQTRKNQKKETLAVLDEVAQWYRAQVSSSAIAKDYVKTRGLDEAVQAQFNLGYAPPTWGHLLEAFPTQETELQNHGLLIAHEDSGRVYSRFRGRLMFPIRDAQGQVVAFGGRSLGEDKPKYLNSPETPWFDKSTILYGLFEAKQAIRNAGYALVVEGYMDVISLVQHGVSGAVATLGTSISEIHVRTLLRTTDVLYVCFDGDVAGHKAAWRAMQQALRHLKDHQKVFFLFLPEDHDPDSWVRKWGGEAFVRWLHKEKQPLSAYLLQQLLERYPPHTTEDKAALLHKLSELLSIVRAPVLKTLLMHLCSERLGVDVHVVEHIQEHVDPVNGNPVARARAPQTRRKTSVQPKVMCLEHRLLQCVIHYPELAEHVVFPETLELNEPLNHLSCIAAYIRAQQGRVSMAQLFEYAASLPWHHQLQESLDMCIRQVEALPERPAATKYLQEGLQRAVKLLYRKQLQDLMSKAKHESLSHQEQALMLVLLQNVQ